MSVQIIFEALIAVALATGAWFFRQLTATMKELTQTIVDLRLEVAKMHANHDARIAALEVEMKRIRDSEDDL